MADDAGNGGGEKNGQGGRQEQAKQKLALWTVAIPAVVGLIGGGISGGITSYTTLSAKREEYSIQRAKEFRSLMEELLDEKKSRLAVLNLWQLYPNERDRRVITAAAFAVNQPDLVELVAGIDEHVNPIADMLNVRALSSDPEIQVPALRTLINIDPVRAAGLLIDNLSDDLAQSNGKMPPQRSGFNPMQELERLTAQNDTVAEMVRDRAEGDFGTFFDYVLYRADRTSNFVDRLSNAFEQGEGLALANDYLYRAAFRERDRERVVTAAAGHVATALEGDELNEFELAGVLASLKNGDFFSTLDGSLGDDFTEKLVNVAASGDHVDILRRRAVELLDIYSPKHAVIASVTLWTTEPANEKLRGQTETYLSKRKISRLARDNPEFTLPPCEGESYVDCIKTEPQQWIAWLADVPR